MAAHALEQLVHCRVAERLAAPPLMKMKSAEVFALFRIAGHSPIAQRDNVLDLGLHSIGWHRPRLRLKVDFIPLGADRLPAYDAVKMVNW